MYPGGLGVIVITALLTTPLFSYAELESNHMRLDYSHIRSWNQFVDDVYALHKKQISNRQILTKEELGGYASHPEFYKEVVYIDKVSGKPVSKIQWVKNKPDVIHSLEVLVRDKQGRVIRDYSAAYLPGQRNAPVQTLINLHNYNDKLHAFRQYDVSADVIYEYCEGEFKGKKRQLRLFESDITAADYESRQLMNSALYKACFGGLPQQLGKYLKPQ